MQVDFYLAATIPADLAAQWRSFICDLPCRHYTQDPAWALVAGASHSPRPRTPLYSWAIADGRIVLAAAGYRQLSPVPRYFYYDLSNGPAFRSLAVFDEWLEWLKRETRDDAVYVRMTPYWRLDEGGEQVEETLARRGYSRDATAGTKATLEVDLTGDAEAVMKRLNHEARRNIRRCCDAGLVVEGETGSNAIDIFCTIYAGLAARIGIEPLRPQDIIALDEHWPGPGRTHAVLIGRIGGRPVSAAIVLVHGTVAYLIKGGSVRLEGNPGLGYCYAWEAMRWSLERGCTVLDVCGFNLKAQPGDPLWGVNKFKLNLGHRLQPIELCAQHDLEVRPSLQRVIAGIRRAKSRLSSGKGETR